MGDIGDQRTKEDGCCIVICKPSSHCFVNFYAGESKGYTRVFVLSLQNKYKHSILHSAINSGDVQVRRITIVSL